MPTILRNFLAIALGIVFGGSVNMALITISPSLIPPPAGVNVQDPQSLAQNIHLFELRHFIMPFLAHALGTFTGALIAYLLAANYKKQLAYGIGALYLAGGIAACFMIPAPVWFMAFDLLLAYLPMACLAIMIGARLQASKTNDV